MMVGVFRFFGFLFLPYKEQNEKQKKQKQNNTKQKQYLQSEIVSTFEVFECIFVIRTFGFGLPGGSFFFFFFCLTFFTTVATTSTHLSPLIRNTVASAQDGWLMIRL